jgi:chemotaxis family two-component system sensor kinase Cph1
MAFSSVVDAITHLPLHGHQCLIYETQAEQFAATLPYLKQGLQQGAYCFYIVDQHTAQAVREGMHQHDIAVDEAEKTGQLAILTQQETYLRDGRFDPGRMIAFVEEACQRARAAGFSAMRGTGEMTWHLGSDATLEQLLVYESRLTEEIFDRHPIIGMCQYSLDHFSPDFLHAILETHPIVVYKDVVCDNYFYIPPGEFLAEQLDTRAQLQRRLQRVRESAHQRQELLHALAAQKHAELEALEKLGELEEFHDVAVGREIRMIALEKENAGLKKKLTELQQASTARLESCSPQPL